MATTPPAAITATGDVSSITSTILAFSAGLFHGPGLLIVENTGLEALSIEVAYSVDGTVADQRDYGAEQSINGDSGLLAGERRGAQIPGGVGSFIRIRAYTASSTTTITLNIYRPPRFRYPEVGP